MRRKQPAAVSRVFIPEVMSLNLCARKEQGEVRFSSQAQTAYRSPLTATVIALLTAHAYCLWFAQLLNLRRQRSIPTQEFERQCSIMPAISRRLNGARLRSPDNGKQEISPRQANAIRFWCCCSIFRLTAGENRNDSQVGETIRRRRAA